MQNTHSDYLAAELCRQNDMPSVKKLLYNEFEYVKIYVYV